MPTKFKGLVLMMSLGLTFIFSFTHKEAASTKPNIVVIYADDLGYGDLGAFGATDIRTPNIDALAAKGLKFTEFYSASPVCSPSRTALLTGRYPRRSGVDGVFFPESYTGLPASEVTIAEALKENGYTTGVVGKWHLGHHKQYLPLQNGFDDYFGIPYSNDMLGVVYIRGNEVESTKIDQRYTTQTYTKEAIKFIEKSKDKPFFLYVPHTMPHVPLYASENFLGKSKRGLYGDVVEELDWSVGEIVKTLRKNGLEENTLIVFSSDNGPWLAYDIEGGSAGPLREGKQTTFEGGMRVPTIAYWPEKIKAGSTYNDIATMFDWFPTFLSVAGAKNYKPLNPLDGEDISAVLKGEGRRKGDELIYYYNGEVQAFRKGDWKIKLPYKGNKAVLGMKDVEPHDTLLFHLKQDVGEQANLLATNRNKAKELLKALEAHKARLGSASPLVQRMPADDSHIKRYQERRSKSN